jgi:uncharacterized protein DUF3999
MKLAAALLALILALPAAAEQPTDFAFGIPIEASGQGALLRFEVPQPVYEGMVRADLGDLRVFNAAGEVVPYAFLPRAAPSREKLPAVALPLFPLRGDSAAGVEGLDITVDRSSGKTAVTVNTREGKAGAQLVGYLVDASSLDQAIQALALVVSPGAENFVARIRVESSDNLADWTTLAAAAPIVQLENGGRRVEQLRVEIPPRKLKYLRISWPRQTREITLDGVSAEPGEAVVEAARAWKWVTGTSDKDRPGDYAFDLGAQFPVDRLRFKLPQPNTVVTVEILSRAKPSDPWRRAAATVAYSLAMNGLEVSSPELAIVPDTDRYWLLRVDQRGGGLGAGAPSLGAGWVPHGLVFVARGAAPFQLAYGSRDAKPAAYPIQTLVPGYRSDADPGSKQVGGKAPGAIEIGQAVTGAPRALAGADATRERIDWKRWTLWASLVLGVVLLGWMALRLGRQMAKTGQEAPGESKSEERGARIED